MAASWPRSSAVAIRFAILRCSVARDGRRTESTPPVAGSLSPRLARYLPPHPMDRHARNSLGIGAVLGCNGSIDRDVPKEGSMRRRMLHGVLIGAAGLALTLLPGGPARAQKQTVVIYTAIENE